MKNYKWTKFGAYLSLIGLIASCSSLPDIGRILANDDGFRPQTAYEAWGTLNSSATSYNANAMFVGDEGVVPGRTSGITFGAEKEASSSLVTRIMGISDSRLLEKVKQMPTENRKKFLKDFLSNYIKDANGYRTYLDHDNVKVDLAKDVVDIDGNPKIIDITEIKKINFDTATLPELEKGFKEFLSQTDGRPFSFINPRTKMKLFDGRLPGQTGKLQQYNSDYTQWKPNFGKAQRYIDAAHGHGGGVGGGWELTFIPLDTYGEFEEMVAWFRLELSQVIKDPATFDKKIKLFQAPGHQRMVFKRHPNLPADKLAEMYRMIQTYIVISGIQGNTKIEFANWKSIHSDQTIKTLDARQNRGVIRVEGDRWGTGTLGIEFRAGTKDLNTARFYQTALAARVTANDFGGIANIGDYKLFTPSAMTNLSISRNFNIPIAKVKKAKDLLKSVGVKESYQVQFWIWSDPGNPFLSETKKVLINSLTHDYVDRLAKLSDMGHSADVLKKEVRRIGQGWLTSTRIKQDLENYMRPKRMFSANLDNIDFTPPAGRRYVPAGKFVDVNSIDLGIEYSGKFPIAVRGDFSKERFGDGKKAWIQTKVDLTSDERSAIIKKVAKDLGKELGSTAEPIEADVDGHGHGLDVQYTIRDSKDRKWIVEWDGIGRNYTPSGEIIADSPRGGSIELVTPKFVPELDEINSVFKAFENNNIMPQMHAGGGHINIDLAAFEGKPKQLARFLTIFHEHRGVIALMFQHVKRSHTSEPVDISDNLAAKLKNFTGTESQLKKLLYDERYFNTRFGRKTRYIQFDLSAYFQDVIPKEFLTDDFDISSPTVDWRRTFRVDPKIRKGEFRMFNAPRDAMESALQIKLVRAMLSKALNENGTLSGEVNGTRHLDYLKNPAQADIDLKLLCDDLGLDINEFRPSVAEGLGETDKASRSIFFQPIHERLANNPFQEGWGKAVEARAQRSAITSTGREWTPGPADETNTMTNAHRVRAAEEAQALRQGIVPARELPGEFVRTGSCNDLIDDII